MWKWGQGGQVDEMGGMKWSSGLLFYTPIPRVGLFLLTVPMWWHHCVQEPEDKVWKRCWLMSDCLTADGSLRLWPYHSSTEHSQLLFQAPSSKRTIAG